MEPWVRPSAIIFILAVYFSMIALGLSVLTPSGHFDDTIVLKDAQSFQWGYEAKSPPLFAWLARTVMLLTGPRLEVVFALRMACLFAAFFGLVLLARRLQPDPVLAAGGGLAIVATLHLHWYFLDKYTNTTLAMAMMPYAVLAFLRLRRHAGASPYIWFGLAAGIGLLTRYHFAVLLLAMIGAALINKTWRPMILDRRMLLALAVVLLIVAPHLLWYLTQLPALAGELKFATGYRGTGEGIPSALQGLGSLAEETVFVLIFPLGLLLLIFFLPSFRPVRVEDPDRRADLRLLRDTVLIALGIMVAFALAGATRIRSRHLFFLALVPIWLTGRMSPAGLRPWAAPGFVLVLYLLLGAAGLGFGFKNWAYAERCTRCEKVLPFEDYAKAVREAGFAGGTIVLSREMSRGAIFRTYFPDSRVVPAFQYKSKRVPLRAHAAGDCLFVWRAGGRDAQAARFKRGDVIPGVGLPLPDHAVFGKAQGMVALSGREAVTMGFVLIKAGLGNCR
jgi:4-amino-4-deoxy-L-arabinose transferase-like glycosyltransferase